MSELKDINRVFDQTSSYIHFPFNYITAKYETAQYRNNLTGDEVTTEEVTHIIDTMHIFLEEVQFAKSLRNLKITVGAGLLLFAALRLLAFVDYLCGVIPFVDYLHMGFGALLFIAFFSMLTVFCVKASNINNKANAFLEKEAAKHGHRLWKWYMGGVFSLNLRKDQIVKERNFFFFDGPDSNEDTIVLNYYAADDNFSIKGDIAILTNGHANQGILDNINLEFQKLISSSKLGLARGFLDNYFFIFCLLVMVSAGLGIMSLVSPNAPIVNYAGHIFYVEQILALIYIFVHLYFQYHLSQKVRQQALDIVENHNKLIEKKGLRWYLPSFFPYWMELWRDYTLPFRPSRRHMTMVDKKHANNHVAINVKKLVEPLLNDNSVEEPSRARKVKFADESMEVRQSL